MSKALNRNNNFLKYWRWSTKYPNYTHNLVLVVVDNKIVEDFKKTSEKSNMDSTKLESDYIRDIKSWMLKDSKGGVGNNFNDG